MLLNAHLLVRWAQRPGRLGDLLLFDAYLDAEELVQLLL